MNTDDRQITVEIKVSFRLKPSAELPDAVRRELAILRAASQEILAHEVEETVPVELRGRVVELTPVLADGRAPVLTVVT